MANTAERVYSLIKDTVESAGVVLWDVQFLKEGATWYLRVFIDKPDGISIDDCADVSRAIDPIIDEADPIDVSYNLEVCSTGIERQLSKPFHFEWAKDKKIKIRLYKAIDGKKEFTGILKSAGEEITVETENGEETFKFSAVSKAHLCDL